MHEGLQVSIVWIRKDFRLSDNLALHHAAKAGIVLPVFIYNDTASLKMGSVSQWWLHHSLKDLHSSLENKLQVYTGNPEEKLFELATKHNIKHVYFNSSYEPEQLAQDKFIQKSLQNAGIVCEIFHSQLLWDPAKIVTGYGTPYKVYTPFYQKGCLHADAPRFPIAKPEKLVCYNNTQNSISIDALGLLENNTWNEKLSTIWTVGEKAAQDRLKSFIAHGLEGYKENRNIPSLDGTSRLSAYLHFGQISVNQVWYAVHKASAKNIPVQDSSCYLSEIGWREFCYNLLFNFPELPHKNFNAKFDAFPWVYNEEFFTAWKQGNTGIPIVDAGMRELAQTGYMHNRVRMIVASFLIKNLGIDWRLGKDWFWECLVDADLANNSANWQWVAGSGADAAPFFRIFNPVLQGEKFDPHGLYTRKYVPELALMPDKYLYKPWMAPANILKQACVSLGKNYPAPIVELDVSRNKALAAYKSL